MVMEKRFWDGVRWNGHAAFNTVCHHHVSSYFPADGHESCDIMVVGCSDGRWYVEDNWGGDANGVEGVWNPFDSSDSGPVFFSSREDAIKYAVAVVASVAGVPESDVSCI